MFKKITARVSSRTLLDHRRGFEGHWLPEPKVGQAVTEHHRTQWRVISWEECVRWNQLEQIACRGVAGDINVEMFSGLTDKGYTDILQVTRSGCTVKEIRTREGS